MTNVFVALPKVYTQNIVMQEQDLLSIKEMLDDGVLQLDLSFLSQDKVEEFNLLSEIYNFTEEEKSSLLDMYKNNQSDILERGIKGKITKETAKKIAHWIEAYIGDNLASKTINDFVDYITGYQDNIENAIYNGCVRYFGMSDWWAEQVAKTVMFVFF